MVFDIVCVIFLLDEMLDPNILNEKFPEDIFLIDNNLFVKNKFQSGNNIDLFKPNHEFTFLRIKYLCVLIKTHKYFKVNV